MSANKRRSNKFARGKAKYALTLWEATDAIVDEVSTLIAGYAKVIVKTLVKKSLKGETRPFWSKKLCQECCPLTTTYWNS